MEREQATKFIYDLLRALLAKRGSDLFLTAGFPPAMKIDSKMTPVSQQALSGQHTAMLVRVITTSIPNFEDLKLPAVLKDVAMTKRGLVLFVGGTGSGKSTSLAAMIGYR